MKWIYAACMTVAFVTGCSEKTPHSLSHTAHSLSHTASHTAREPTPDGKARCDEAGEKWFKENYALPSEQAKDATGKATYSVHYSPARKRCFLESIANAHIGKEANASVSGESEIHRLIDLSTGEQVGQYVTGPDFSAPLVCEVGDIKCGTREDWDTLTGPYMRN